MLVTGCSSITVEESQPKLKQNDKVKKIEVTKTNNKPFFALESKFVFPQPKGTDLKKLKSYITSKGFNPKSSNESDFVVEALAWVTAQWAHDGINQPPKHFKALDILKKVHNEKEKYRCVEYGIVLSEVLQAYGFVARTVALRSNDVAYGGWGKGHVAMEVWINDLKKWIFLDPQFGSYLTESGSKTPLNFYELYQIKSSGKWKSTQVRFASKPPQPIKQAASEYKGFLENYFGHITVSSGKKTPQISLMLELEKPVMTFQAHPYDNVVFTTDQDLVYPQINQVSILLNYKDKADNFNKLVKSLGIDSDQTYVDKMHHFAAKPNFSAKFLNNMPYFSHYEYRLNGEKKWHKAKGDEVQWSALNANSSIETRAVNTSMRNGPTTFIKLSYK